MYIVNYDPCIDNLSLNYEYLSSFEAEIYLLNEDKIYF